MYQYRLEASSSSGLKFIREKSGLPSAHEVHKEIDRAFSSNPSIICVSVQIARPDPKYVQQKCELTELISKVGAETDWVPEVMAECLLKYLEVKKRDGSST